MARYLYRLGSFSFHHRRIVAAAWLVILAALVVGSQSVNATTSNSFSIPGTEGQRALDLLSKKFPGTGGATARIVFAAPKGHTLAESQYQGLIAPALAAAGKVPQVLTPAKALSTPVLSKDKTIGFATCSTPSRWTSFPTPRGRALTGSQPRLAKPD